MIQNISETFDGSAALTDGTGQIARALETLDAFAGLKLGDRPRDKAGKEAWDQKKAIKEGYQHYIRELHARIKENRDTAFASDILDVFLKKLQDPQITALLAGDIIYMLDSLRRKHPEFQDRIDAAVQPFITHGDPYTSTMASMMFAPVGPAKPDYELAR